MRRYIPGIAVLLCLVSTQAETLEVILAADNLPPFIQFTGESVPSGPSGDMVVALSRLVGVESFEKVPFARLMHDLGARSEVVAFPVVRAPSREADYCWILPLVAEDLVLVGLSDGVIDPADHPTIAETRGSVLHELVSGINPQKVEFVNDVRLSFAMMANGRVQAWIGAPYGLDALIEATGMKREQFHVSKPVAQMRTYLVARRDYSRERLARWRSALAELKRSGQWAEISRRYEGLAVTFPAEEPKSGCN